MTQSSKLLCWIHPVLMAWYRGPLWALLNWGLRLNRFSSVIPSLSDINFEIKLISRLIIEFSISGFRYYEVLESYSLMFALEIWALEGYSGACNDSSHILDCQRVSAIFAGKILSLFFSQFSQKYFSQNFASFLHFSLYLFSRKNAKFRGKVCEMRTKIFEFFRETFRSLETLLVSVSIFLNFLTD